MNSHFNPSNYIDKLSQSEMAQAIKESGNFKPIRDYAIRKEFNLLKGQSIPMMDIYSIIAIKFSLSEISIIKIITS